MCGTENVNIAVTVKVCSIDIVGPIKIIINSVLNEIFLPIVLPPGDLIGASCCPKNIYIAITIYIRGINRRSARKIIINNVLGEVLATIIFPPDNIIIINRNLGIICCPQDVYVTVTIYISGVNITSTSAGI